MSRWCPAAPRPRRPRPPLASPTARQSRCRVPAWPAAPPTCVSTTAPSGRTSPSATAIAVFDDYVEAWNAGDLEAWLDVHADEAEYTPLAAGDGRVYRGREGLREAWRESRANWDRFAFAIVADEDGLVQVEFSGIESLNASRVSGELWFRVHERDGRIARLWSALEPATLPG